MMDDPSRVTKRMREEAKACDEIKSFFEPEIDYT